MSNKKQHKPRDIDAQAVAGAAADGADGVERADEKAFERGHSEADELTANTEISEKSEDTDNAEQNEDYGKFSSLQDLLSAYNALQSEFTKRCQLIKQLQALRDEDNAQAQIQDIAADKLPSGARTQSDSAVGTAPDTAVALSSACDGEARLAEAVAVIAENIDECADYLASLPQIADAVILAYKKKLLGARACASPRGMAVVMPAMRPKTLADAKRLADEMLRTGR